MQPDGRYHVLMPQSPGDDNMVPTDEQTDVLRIRLWNPQRATALLAEFHAADRVLESWADRPDCNPVDFEVTFIDGHILRGCHEFFRRGKRKCLFSTHVRKLLHRAGAPAPTV
jgi:hypothetical protein